MIDKLLHYFDKITPYLRLVIMIVGILYFFDFCKESKGMGDIPIGQLKLNQFSDLFVGIALVYLVSSWSSDKNN